MITVSGADILVEGRRVATIQEAMATPGDLIAGLKQDAAEKRTKIVKLAPAKRPRKKTATAKRSPRSRP